MSAHKVDRRYKTGTSNYDKNPFVQITNSSEDCHQGWEEIISAVKEAILKITGLKKVIVLETYHGVYHSELQRQLIFRLNPDYFFSVFDIFRSEAELDKLFGESLGTHPIFGRMTDFKLQDFLDPHKLLAMTQDLSEIDKGTVIIYGPGASLAVSDVDLLIYADMARWEIQQRMRRNRIANLGSFNFELSTSLQYKRAYFIDWRVCDIHKRTIMHKWDYLLDTNTIDSPKLISGDSFRLGLERCAARPFRVVPFFDPGVWGGQWMREVCSLDAEAVNYAWCFDCVPEENSLLFAFGDRHVEIPSINLVFNQPAQLLGERIYHRFGAEFPIRFDFLDTMEGGNLSLQVHPLKEYIKEHFGMSYTQDESYYLLDVKDDAAVYLGQREGIDPLKMMEDLERAEAGRSDFDADKYIQKWSVKKHDHVLIPAGTVHCSGRNSMVLEISATPYIFTFKLWDWGRVDLDGKPRPISLEHGKNVIQWDRTKDWVQEELLNQVERIGEGDGWREERTGLHKSEFIETRRHWFTKQVLHDTEGNLNVLNLVEGDEVVVESPTQAFAPFEVHYAETFIVPAAVGLYTIRPSALSVAKEYATMKAFVR